MLSIVDQAPAEATPAATLEAAPIEAQATPEPQLQEAAEYEIVLGRAQIASWLFVGVIAIAACSSLAFLAGRAAGAKKPAIQASAADAKPSSPSTATTAPATPVTPQPVPVQMPSASLVVNAPTPGAQTSATSATPAKPMFAEPESGKVYIQMGAVEKGMATILAEGLRSHGFDAFVAPGPSDKIYRVLIGPLPDPEAFRKAKAAVDAIELSTFARKYEK